MLRRTGMKILFITATAAILTGGAFLSAHSNNRPTSELEFQEEAPLIQPVIENDPPTCTKCPSSAIENPANHCEDDAPPKPVDQQDEVEVIEVDGEDFPVDEETRELFSDPARCTFDFAGRLVNQSYL